MLIISDTFNLDYLLHSQELELPNIKKIILKPTITLIPESEIKDRVEILKLVHPKHMSVVSTKKACNRLSKVLGINLDIFKPGLFDKEDFIKMTKDNTVLFCNYCNERDCYTYYLVDLV